eukprot:TRINITY_DN7806_c0_g1_i3.p1 TRINITY_DN7806_c0_g1~~TRINITY_DN7806_c0_g1_i3.p1  ORF type:complete len:784 (-),score=200.37 TRINITY_DN7806_c0_g1_i3:21-2372(-)
MPEQQLLPPLTASRSSPLVSRTSPDLYNSRGAGGFGVSPPSGSLPRHVAAPCAGADSAEAQAAAHCRFSSQREGLSRSGSLRGPLGGSLPQELPPLRDGRDGARDDRGRDRDGCGRDQLPPPGSASMLGPSGHWSGSLATFIRRGAPAGESFADSLRSDLRTPYEGHHSLRASGRPGARMGSELPTDSRASTFHEIEELKQQVARLAQMRIDRDGYIQDYMMDTEAPPPPQKKHECDTTRRISQRSQREAVDWLQATQVDLELKELRAGKGSDGERKLTEKHRAELAELRRGVEALGKQLSGHAEVLMQCLSGKAATGAAAAAAVEVDLPEDDPAISDGAQGVMRALYVARMSLERALIVGQRVVRQAATSSSGNGAAATARRADAKGSPEVLAAWRSRCLTRTLAAYKATGEHWRHVAFRAWAAVATRSRLEEKAEKAKKENAALEEELRTMTARLYQRIRGHALSAARAWAESRSRASFVAWALATLLARREASHRQLALAAAADASAEVYNLRIEHRRALSELRRQRRAHGVAAIHANLDRCLQAVLCAWCAVVKDRQRETMYRQRLDAVAVEAAAEARRGVVDLREQRLTYAMKAVDARIHHWRHALLLAWARVAARLKFRPASPECGDEAEPGNEATSAEVTASAEKACGSGGGDEDAAEGSVLSALAEGSILGVLARPGAPGARPGEDLAAAVSLQLRCEADGARERLIQAEARYQAIRAAQREQNEAFFAALRPPPPEAMGMAVDDEEAEDSEDAGLLASSRFVDVPRQRPATSET